MAKKTDNDRTQVAMRLLDLDKRILDWLCERNGLAQSAQVGQLLREKARELGALSGTEFEPEGR